MAFKIYTKTGDKGETSLIGGTRVPKFHLRIESYGTVDELNSYLGLLNDKLTDTDMKDVLYEIQDRLFTIGSMLANEEGNSKMKLPDLVEKDITFLESKIDTMNETLPELKSFILPGGHATASVCQIARCICRRAERLVVQLSTESLVPNIIIRYLNRLSDYLFVLSRQIIADNGCSEIMWLPRES